MKTISVQSYNGRQWRVIEWYHPDSHRATDPQPIRSLEWRDESGNWHTDESWPEETRRPIPAAVQAWASSHGVRLEPMPSVPRKAILTATYIDEVSEIIGNILIGTIRGTIGPWRLDITPMGTLYWWQPRDEQGRLFPEHYITPAYEDTSAVILDHEGQSCLSHEEVPPQVPEGPEPDVINHVPPPFTITGDSETDAAAYHAACVEIFAHLPQTVVPDDVNPDPEAPSPSVGTMLVTQDISRN